MPLLPAVDGRGIVFSSLPLGFQRHGVKGHGHTDYHSPTKICELDRFLTASRDLNQT